MTLLFEQISMFFPCHRIRHACHKQFFLQDHSPCSLTSFVNVNEIHYQYISGIDGLRKMTTVINTYHQSIELVERFAQCLLKDCKNKNDVEVVKQLAPYITYFSSQIELTGKKDGIFEKFVTQIDSATEKPDCDVVLQQFHEEIEKVKKQLSSGGKNKAYNSFMKMISEANLEDGDNEGDDEIRTVLQSVNTVDPITKLPLVEPVKNKNCGHTYEKTAILQLIEQNPRVKCPIPGCSATEFVRKSDLVPDNTLKRMLSSTNGSSQKKLKVGE